MLLRLTGPTKLVRQVKVDLIVPKLLVFVIKDILVKSLVLLQILQVFLVIRYDFLLVLDVRCFIETIVEVVLVVSDLVPRFLKALLLEREQVDIWR